MALKICKIEGCERATVAKELCNRHYRRMKDTGNTGDVTIRPQAPRGSGCIHPTGYRKFLVNGKYIMEHRLVMEEYLGRKLTKYENIHHKDGNRLNNDISNLELWNHKQPIGQRIEDKIKWAEDILKQYKPDYEVYAFGGTL